MCLRYQLRARESTIIEEIHSPLVIEEHNLHNDFVDCSVNISDSFLSSFSLTLSFSIHHLSTVHDQIPEHY